MKKILLPILFLLPACYTEQLISPPKKEYALDYVYDDLPYPLKTWFLNLTVNYDFADVNSTQLDNLQTISQAIEAIRTAGYDAISVSRCWIGPEEEFEDAGGYYDQRHRACEGVTFDDWDGLMWQFIQDNDLLNTLNLYARDPQETPGQLYLQIVASPSGDRVFTL